MIKETELISSTELACHLGIKPGTLSRWRRDGVGPAFIHLRDGKFSRAMYSPVDVRRWLEERRAATTPRPTGDGGGRIASQCPVIPDWGLPEKYGDHYWEPAASMEAEGAVGAEESRLRRSALVLLDTAGKTCYEDCALLYLITRHGLSLAEACALKWPDFRVNVDGERPHLVVVRHFIDGQIRDLPEASRRQIFLDLKDREVLDTLSFFWIEGRAENAWRAPCDFLFTYDETEPLTPEMVDEEVMPGLCEQVGLPRVAASDLVGVLGES